jgi:hypothetical protein
MAVSNRSLNHERRAYADVRLWQAWKGLSFLVPEQETLIKFDPEAMPSLSAARQTLLVLWPYGDLRSHLEALPHPVQIEVHVGPLTRGDLEKEAYPAYASYTFEPLGEKPAAPIARFGDSIELTDFTVETEGHVQEVRLMWRARDPIDEDYTAFVYLCRARCAEDSVVAQHDEQPGEGYYPTRLWFPGDVIVDAHTFELPRGEPIPSSVAVGLYSWPSIERLPVTSPSGTPVGDKLILPTGDQGHDPD